MTHSIKHHQQHLFKVNMLFPLGTPTLATPQSSRRLRGRGEEIWRGGKRGGIQGGDGEGKIPDRQRWLKFSARGAYKGLQDLVFQSNTWPDNGRVIPSPCWEERDLKTEAVDRGWGRDK